MDLSLVLVPQLKLPESLPLTMSICSPSYKSHKYVYPFRLSALASRMMMVVVGLSGIQETVHVSILPLAPLIFLDIMNFQLDTSYNQLKVELQGTEELPR